MKEFHLHKYPVTSVEGNEYAVSIYNDRHSKGFVKVSLYKKVRGFFRKKNSSVLQEKETSLRVISKKSGITITYRWQSMKLLTMKTP